MRLWCFGCGKTVSNELPEGTVVRAILTCPECLRAETDKTLKVYGSKSHFPDDKLKEAMRMLSAPNFKTNRKKVNKNGNPR